MVLGVSDGQCQEGSTQEAKKISVLLQSMECTKGNYEGYSINIDDKVGQAKMYEPDVFDLPIKPGDGSST